IEPTHAAPEATALSTELQTHLLYITILFQKLQPFFLILENFCNDSAGVLIAFPRFLAERLVFS
ncbi:MAG: hypothetical protein ACLT46_07045, partial [Hungatella sp.]